MAGPKPLADYPHLRYSNDTNEIMAYFSKMNLALSSQSPHICHAGGWNEGPAHYHGCLSIV